MSRTRKTDAARALHAPDVVRKTGETDRKPKETRRGLVLIATGQADREGNPVHLDTGGVRHGNNRRVKAWLKVASRRSRRKRENRIPDGE